MTRVQLAKAVSKATGFRQIDTKVVVTAVFEELAKAMASGETVEIENFGKLTVLKRKPRVCTHPMRPNEKITIPSRNVAHFTPSQMLKDFVNGEIDYFYVRGIDKQLYVKNESEGVSND